MSYNRRSSESTSSSSRSRQASTASSATSVVHFMEFFETECGVKEIEVIIGRNRYGRKLTEALIEYIRLRVELEQSYAKGLEKLAKFEFPGAEPIMNKALKPYGGFDTAYKENAELHLGAVLAGLQYETKALAAAQKTFAAHLSVEILDPFKKSFNAQVGMKERHKYRLFDAAEQITKQQKVLAQHKAKCLEFQQKLTVAEGVATANPEDHRAHSNVDQMRNGVDSAEQRVLDIDRALEGKQREFQEGLSRAAREIYDSELARLHITYEKLDGFAGLLRDHAAGTMKNFAESLMLSLSRTNAEMELLDFARKYAGHRAVESNPAAEACYDQLVRSRPFNAHPPKPLVARKPMTYRYAHQEEQEVPTHYQHEEHESEEY